MSSAHKNLSDFQHIEVRSAKNRRFGIIVSQWNVEVTGKLLEGAIRTLQQHGVDENSVEVIHVPGSYELIGGADLLLQRKKLDAVICLGCVIQGETRHFDFICQAVGIGLAQVGLKHDRPIIFGVLTTDNQEQALDRSGGRHGNKGEEAAITAIQMATLF